LKIDRDQKPQDHRQKKPPGFSYNAGYATETHIFDNIIIQASIWQ
jgi:hypothetical protein